MYEQVKNCITVHCIFSLTCYLICQNRQRHEIACDSHLWDLPLSTPMNTLIDYPKPTKQENQIGGSETDERPTVIFLRFFFLSGSFARLIFSWVSPSE